MEFPDEYFENWNYFSGTLTEGARFMSGRFETQADAERTANEQMASGIEVWRVTHTEGVRSMTLAASVQTE